MSGVTDTPPTASRLDVRVAKDKCQGFGACDRVAPDLFALDASQRAEFRGAADSSPETILRAARSCPYKAIVVVDAATHEQLYPVKRRDRG